MIKVYFSGIRDILYKNIGEAKQSINIAIAWFTQRELFYAILNALDRGVSVSIILIDDIINRNEYGLDFSLFIKKGGKLCFANSRKSLMHNKFCIFDNIISITGSYNWTYSAETRNYENIVLTDDRHVTSSFYEQFLLLWSCEKPLADYTHLYISEIKENEFIRDYDYISDEINNMVLEKILAPSAKETIEKTREGIAVNRIGTLQKANHRKNPRLKQTIGMRCRINNNDNMVLHIIEEGQKLPFCNQVSTMTVEDNQTSVLFEIVYGKSEIADENTSLFKNSIDGFPPAKAGEIKFKTKVTLDTNGYMHIEHVCENTGNAIETVYNIPDKILYE